MSERDKALAKAIGKCYHEFDSNLRHSGVIWPCKHCGDEFLTTQKANANKSLNFSTWSNFGRLWEWAEKQKWFREFLWHQKPKSYWSNQVAGDVLTGVVNVIGPDKLADAILKYLKYLESIGVKP